MQDLEDSFHLSDKEVDEVASLIAGIAVQFVNFKQ